MVWLVKRVVLLLTLVIWAIVAFILWIPLLTRSIAVFSGGIILSVLSRTDPEMYAKQLRLAMSFYADGFRFIIDSILSESRGDIDRYDAEPPLSGIVRLIGELIWAVIFWVGVLFTLDHFRMAPDFFHDMTIEIRSFINSS